MMSIACLFEWSSVSYAQYLELEAWLEASGKVNRKNIAYEGMRMMAIGVWDSQPALYLFLNCGFGGAPTSGRLPRPQVTTWSLPGGSVVEDNPAFQMMSAAVYQTGLLDSLN